MERISSTEKITTETSSVVIFLKIVLRRMEEKRTIVEKIARRKKNRIGHIMR